MKHETDSFEKATVIGHPYSVTIPRWIDVPNVQNFRDIGGYPIKDGSGYIRERTIFRCGHLGNITDDGIKTLQKLNVTAVFDFRSEPEIERYGKMPCVQGITYYPSAMYKSIDVSPTKMADHWKAYFEGPEGIARAYLHTLEVAKEQYGKIFLHIIEQFTPESRKSLIAHCTAGKDRTGLFIALLLGLLNVDEEIIAKEYALTNIGFWVTDEEIAFRAKAVGCKFEQMKEATSAP
ncbi:tyrosine phosphatase family-domain-containing protein [Cunninghamella echinulata]|nr:tyrosine phosphatase family-domain-containing protein [Cunninghamella echinulata]